MSDLFAETGSAVYERLLDDGDPNLRLAGALLAPRAPDAARYVPRMLRLAVPARSDGAEGLLLDAIARIGVSAEPGLMAALREGARKPDAIQSRRALCVLELLGEGGTPCSQEALLAVVDALRTPHRLEEPGLQAAVEARRLQACRVLNTRSFRRTLRSVERFSERIHVVTTLLQWLTGESRWATPARKVLVRIGELALFLIYQAATNPARVVAEAGWGHDEVRVKRLRVNLAMLLYQMALDVRATGCELSEDHWKHLVEAAVSLAADSVRDPESSSTTNYAALTLTHAMSYAAANAVCTGGTGRACCLCIQDMAGRPRVMVMAVCSQRPDQA